MKPILMSFLLPLFLAVASTSATKGDVVTLENTKGIKLEAELVSCDGTSLELVRVSDRKSFTIPLSSLSESSRQTVNEWQTSGGGLVELYNINVITGKNRRTTAQEDFDDKRINLDPVVTISNPDTRIATREAKLTVLFLGRPVADGSALHVFSKSTFDLPSLQPNTSQNFKIKKISAAYDSRGYAKFGSRYAGYVVVVHAADERTVYSTKSVPSALVDNNGHRYLKLETGNDYDRNFKRISLPTYTDY